MYCIQYRDLEEGNGARWHELTATRHYDRIEARKHLSRIRATDDEECLYLYRIIEVDSKEYYSQPTDRLEY